MQNTPNFINVSLCALTLTLLFTSCPGAPAPVAKPASQPIDRTISVKDDFISFNNGTNNKYYNLGNNPGDITVTDLEGYSLYTVSLNTNDYPVKSTRLLTHTFRAASNSPILPEVTEEPVRKDFNDWLDYSSLVNYPVSRAANSSEDDIQPFNSETDTRKFWITPNVHSESKLTGNDWMQITSKKMYSGKYCDVFVQTEFYDENGADTEKDGKISLSSLKTLGTLFDGLYELETSLFGAEYTGPKAQTWQSRMLIPDGKITILVHDIECDTQQDTGIFGMFWAKDMWKGQPNGTIPQNGELVLKTNQAEMFYIDSYFLDSSPKAVYSTLAHEFQHMLHFVHKQMTDRNTLASPDWYNEMLSMLCEDLLTSFFEKNISDFNRYDDGPFSRTPLFNRYYIYNGIQDWYDSGYQNLWSYASAYTFGSFLIRNYGGIELVKEMAHNRTFGDKSITSALSALGYEENFETVFWNYALSVAQPNATYMQESHIENDDITLYPHDWWNWYWKIENNREIYGPWNYTIDPGFNLRGWGFIKSFICSNTPSSTLTFEPSFSDGEYVYLVAVK